ncbi:MULTISPECIES: lasso peptide isopeptide bond-forming cyclase [unclassified Streptomyces]|uniref:lasso peptide isopeptide bond-forming cyclase n=1 Tax=unclassified Streptomyces TaxID=2593676 RepID=UPI0013683FEA|nr:MULTISPECIES: lasso peptide isopeptide bond-forming cyclase [unclassified Streptomyces]NEA00433.1 lasso peptide isopeptide bond-forming cyclase [Streptomyces sp. SID10116]MYY84396.1 lasso peptide isopeptide bond-forming cyclase [Streptomyces sp. SID335]MYZ15330.1 lasso peptide isopeptide bond-forming cyclase [Streptomyces sp. SID337]NDZ89415.1 lasso peptide isopeptide bond-forming cyclase [Streptomyces sp. SID10115]NDZ90212.1 lasso peptide isopeptide bond-forming cyclase [Streptomyces sp. S
MTELHESAGTGPGDAHFAVFTDRADAAAAARSFARPGSRTLAHASGRPWLVGHWHDDEVVTACTGGASLAVIGCCPIDADALRRRAARLRDLAELDALARSLPGSFHLVGALDGQIRVQGTASGLRLVFHAEIDGVRVAATRADMLATVLGLDPDVEELAVRLLWPAPYPVFETSMWRAVDAVPPQAAVVVAADGRTVRHTQWWTPPEPVRPLIEAAPLIRRALQEAVEARTRQGGVVSCDLSGGLDSTSVCFLADRSPAHVVASTWPGRDPADTDLSWAERAMAYLPDVEHVVWDPDASPLVYEDLLGIDDLLDEPTIGVMDRSRVLHHLPGLAARGSRLHLTGIGGDHVAWCSEAYYHRLLRTRPLFALRQLRGFRALWQWPLGGTLRALADFRPYGKWLADAAGDLRGPLPPSVATGLGWGMAPRLFDWVTPEAERMARRALLGAASTASPLHPDRGLHTDLEQIRSCARVIRQWDRMAARAGLPMASPFLDDRVIEACLAVRPSERVTPWRYKPVLSAAMRGIVPEECLQRNNKATASMDASNGLREHRADLLALWEDSRLAELGLVDGAELRRLARRPASPGLSDAILYSTIAAEVWLRGLAHGRTRVPNP